MNLTRPLALTALAFGAFAISPSFAAAPADEIKQLEQTINAAYAANDLPKYFSYYADDFRGLFPEGLFSLPDYNKMWTGYIKGGGAVLSFTYTDLVVQVAPGGDAAVASYRATARTKDAGKEPVEQKFLETDVFFKRAGQWKLVEVHYSEVAPSGAR